MCWMRADKPQPERALNSTNFLMAIVWLKFTFNAYFLSRLVQPRSILSKEIDEIVKREINESSSSTLCIAKLKWTELLMDASWLKLKWIRVHLYATSVNTDERYVCYISPIVISISVCQCVMIFLTLKTCDY